MAELPAELAWLKYPAGMEWPEGEEEQLWGLAGDWKQAAAELREILDDIDAAKAASLTAYPVGKGVEEMIKGFDSMRSGDGSEKDQSLEKLAEYFEAVGKSAYDAGTEIEYTKIMFVSSLALLAAEIALCWIPPTPASPGLQAFAIAMTRVAVRLLGQTLTRALVRIARQAVIKTILKFLARHVAIDLTLGTLQELGTQAWQVGQGHRDQINHRQLLVTMISSAAGGAAAGPFAGLLGDRIIKDRMNKWLKAAITGPAAGLMGAEAGNLAAIGTQFGIDLHDQGFDKAWDNATKSLGNHDPLMFTAGASNGLLSSLSGTGAHAFKNRGITTPGVDTMSAPSLSEQIDAIVGINRPDGGEGEGDGGGTRTDDGAGEGRGTRTDDGAGEGTGEGGATRTDDGAGEGAGTRSGDEAGQGESRAGDGTRDGESTSTDSRNEGSTRAGGAGLGSGGSDGSAMRPASASGAGGDSGSGRSEAGDGGNQQATAEGDDATDGGRANDAAGSQRTGEDSRTDDSSADGVRADNGGRSADESPAANRADGAADSPLARGDANGGQRAGVPLGADGLQGADLGVRGSADTGAPVSAVADSDATNAAAAGAAPVVAHAAPAAANPAPATNAPVGGETRGAPAASGATRGVTPDLRQAVGPDMSSALPSGDGVIDSVADSAADSTTDSARDSAADSTSDATVDATDESSAESSRAGTADAVAPSAGDSRAGLADAGRAGADSQPTVRAEHADSEAASARDVAQAGETRGAEPVTGDLDGAVAPVLPVGVGEGAPPHRPRRRAGVPLNDPGPVGAGDADRGTGRADQSSDSDAGTDRSTPDYDHFLPNGQGVVYTPTATSIGNDTSTHNVRNNLRNEGAHDVIVHGSRSGHPIPGRSDRVDPEVIAQAIRDNPDYVPGTPIRLISCHAGADGSWAKQLSDLIGAPVQAPTREVGTTNLPDQPAQLVGGKWETFGLVEGAAGIAASDGVPNSADSAWPPRDFGDLVDNDLMGEQGRSRADLEAALGGPLHEFPDPGGDLPRHQGIVDELMHMARDTDPRDIARGAGPRAFVVDQFVSPGQGLVVGGKPYAMVVGLDPATGQHRVDILDPNTGTRHPYPMPTPRDLHTVSAVLMDSQGNAVPPRGADPRQSWGADRDAAPQAPVAPDQSAGPGDPRSPVAPDQSAAPSDPRSPAADPRLLLAADRNGPVSAADQSGPVAGADRGDPVAGADRDGVRLLDPDEAYALGRSPEQVAGDGLRPGDSAPDPRNRAEAPAQQTDPRRMAEQSNRAGDVVDHIRRTLSEPGAIDPRGDLASLRNQVDGLIARLDGELGDRLAPTDATTRRAIIADAVDQLLARTSPDAVRDAIQGTVRDHSAWEPLARNDSTDIAEPPIRFYDPVDAYETGRNPDLERDAPFGPAVDADGPLNLPDGAGPPRTLEELRRADPDLTFDDLLDLRDASYRDAGIEPPPLSRESLDNLLREVWANRDSVHDPMDVYNLYSGAPEPNVASDPAAYTRAVGDIVDTPSEARKAMLQAASSFPMEPGQSDALGLLPWHFVHFQRTGDAGTIEVGYRVYVNPRIDAAPALMRDLVHDIIDRPDAFPGVRTAKITTPTAERSDAIVVYVRDLDDVQQVTRWLSDYRDRAGDVFLFDAPPMTQQVMEGVGVGAHPKGKSFGHVRAVAIQRALDAVQANGGDFADFLAEVQRQLPAAGVDPNTPHLRATEPPQQAWPDRRDGFDRMGEDEPARPDADDDGDSGRTPPDDRTGRGDDETPAQRAARIRAELADLRADVEANRAEFLHGLADSVAQSDPIAREGESVDSARGRAWQADWNTRQLRADADLLWTSAGGRPDALAPTPDPQVGPTAEGPTVTPDPSAPDPRAGWMADAPTTSPDPSSPDPRAAWMMDPAASQSDSSTSDRRGGPTTDGPTTSPEPSGPDPRVGWMMDPATSQPDSAISDLHVTPASDGPEAAPKPSGPDPRAAWMMDPPASQPDPTTPDPRVGWMTEGPTNSPEPSGPDPRVAWMMDPPASQPDPSTPDPRAAWMMDRDADSGQPDPGSQGPRPDLSAADDWAKAEYDRMMEERNRLAREMEFWRAKRDDRINRLMGIVDPEESLGTRADLANTMRRLASEEASQSTRVAPIGEEAGGQVNERRSQADAAHRREIAAKLEEAARRVIEMREDLAALDRRIAELEVSGALDGRPPSADAAAELDKLARQRANELLRIKARRGMRDDLADRFGLIDDDGVIDEAALSPENLAATIDQLRNDHPDGRTAEIDALALAAREVNEAHNRIGRLQDEMARAAGAARTDIEADGGRMATRDVGVANGDPPRIIVYGPRDQPGYMPREDGLSDHEHALRHALTTSDAVVRAFTRDHATVEFRRITADREGNFQVDPVPDNGLQFQRRTVDYTISDNFGGNVRLDIARWRSADGTWHDVNPDRTQWENRRGSDRTPAHFEGRPLPEGVSSVGVSPTQAAVVDAISGSSGPGINEAFLPKLPGGLSPLNPGMDSHADPVPEAASMLLRITLEVMKFAGWSLFQDPSNPERIKPGFKPKRLIRRFTAEQQPFVNPPAGDDIVGRNPAEAVRTWNAQAERRAEWTRVQRWADEQYETFLRDDSDVAAIADTLRQQRADDQRTRAREMVDAVKRALDEAAAQLPGDGDADTHRRGLIDQVKEILADPDVRFSRNDAEADARRERVRQVFDWLDSGVHPHVIADSIADQMTSRLPELTPENIQQIKRLLMQDSLLMTDPDSGQRRWRPLDRLAHVAEAWNRLTRGEPEPGDLLLISDAWEWSQRLRASYETNDFTRTWDEFQDLVSRPQSDDVTANQRRFDILTWEEIQNQVSRLPGDHWEGNRGPLTEWRADIRYEPPLRSTPDNSAGIRPLVSEPGPNQIEPGEEGPEATGGVPAETPPSRPPAAPGQALREPAAPPSFDRMGDDDSVDAGADPTSPTVPNQDPVPAGMFRGEDGLLHRPGDRPDSYRDPDGTWHQVDDAPNTYRDKGFGYHDADTHWFLRDHLSAAEYEFHVQKGDSAKYTVIDPDLAQQLRDASILRLELQAERDPIGDTVKRLMADFDIERIADLAAERLGPEIQRQQARVEADPTLSEADLIDKLTKLADLEAAATKYNDLGPKLVDASKQLGELAGRAFALDPQVRPGAVLLSPYVGAFDGAGTVDIASMVRAVDGQPPTLVVVEAKGVGSTLGGSKKARAEQGSPEYLRRTLEMDRNLRVILNETPAEMAARGLDPDSEAGRALIDAVRELREAQRDGTLRVEYHLVHASARGEVTVTELLLERDGVNILADVPLPIAQLDTMGADDEVIHYLGDPGDEVPLPRDGQPYGWLLSAPDRATIEVRDLLARTVIGGEALGVLDAVDARLRVGELDDPAPTSFDGRAMDVFVGADGHDRVAQADAVVRVGALADAVIAGRVETTPSQIRALDRDDHITARVRAEAEAFGRQAEFHREVDAAGHDPLSGTTRDPVDTAMRRALDEAYLAAYDAAVDAAVGQDPAPSPEQLRGIGREAGVARLLEHELFDTPDGFSRRDEAAAEWDAHRDPALRAGLDEYVPSNRDTARDLDRLMREQAAASRALMRVEADWDRVCHRLVRGFNLPADELPSTRREISDTLLRRAMDIDIWHGMDNALLLNELTAQHTRATVDRARLVDEIADTVRRDLAQQENAPVDIGRVQVHGDESGVLRVIRDTDTGPEANVDVAPASWLSDPDLTREALARARADHAALVDHANRLYLKPFGELTGWVPVTPLAGFGRWAAEQVAARGVSVRFTIEPGLRTRPGSGPGRGAAPPYDPVTNTLVLDRDSSTDQQAKQMVFAARMADLLADVDGLPEWLTLSRDEYADRMADRVADALALSFRYDADRSEVVPTVDETPLRRVYDEAYRDGLRTATKAYAKLGTVATDDLFHAAAHRAGVRAVRAALADQGPFIGGRDYHDHFGAEWDRARGITPPEPAVDAPSDRTPAPTGRKDARAPFLAMEIESLRSIRDMGDYVPVSPAERAYTDAYDKAHTKAERAQQRDADAPPPERVAAEAGRDALRRYLNRVGPEHAEIVLDVARAGGDSTNPHWGRPAVTDRVESPSVRDTDTTSREFADRALARYLDLDPDGVRLTPQVAEFRQRGLFTWRCLHVVAEPGGHMDALHELAATRPEYATAVWNYLDHEAQFAVPERGPGGEPALRYIPQSEALGALRRPEGDEALAQMLGHYLRYRQEGSTNLGFGDWFDQLGPQHFDNPEQTDRRRRQAQPEHRDSVVRYRGDLYYDGVRAAATPDGPVPAPPHPAEVAHRLATRRIPLLPSAGEYPPHFRRHLVTVGPVRMAVQLEPDGHGRWRVPAPRGDASVADVLATRFQGLTDGDPVQLVNRIARMLEDPAADLNDRSQPRGRFGRFIERLPFGSSPDRAEPVVDRIAAIEPEAGGPGFDRMGDGFQLRPPDEDVDSFDAENERLLGVPGRDEWTGLSPDQVGARLRDELARILDYPDMETIGFDLPGLNWQIVQEFARSMVDMATLHPEVDLRTVSIRPLPWTILARTESRLLDTGGYSSEVMLNYDQATSAGGFHGQVRDSVDGGHFYPVALTRPVYYIAVHEFGHVLDATGQFKARLVAEAQLLRSSRLDPDQSYGDWLDQLSNYSLDDGMLDPGEALAEAFAQTVMLGTDGVSKPVRALHDLLMKYRENPELDTAADLDPTTSADRNRDGNPDVRSDLAEAPFDRLGDESDPDSGAKKPQGEPSRSPDETAGRDPDDPIEPTAVGHPPRVTIDVDGEQVPLNVRPDGDDRWEVVDENAPLADAAPTSRLRREMQFIRESWPQHVEQIKYPSGSPVGDSKGQAAIADGIGGVTDLVESSGAPPAAPVNPTPPTSPDTPVIQAPPEAGGPDPTFLRIAQQLPIWIANREKIPLLGRLSARMRDSAGEHLPMRLPDGSEYQPWYSDVNADDVRTQVTGDLEVDRTTPDEAREALLLAFANADGGQRERIIEALLEHDLISPDDADRLADEPPATPQLPEPAGPRPEGETLAEAAQRLLGIELTDESLPAVQRVIDEQQYRAMRMVGSIEGLAAAVQRFIEEQTMPYGRVDFIERPDSNGLPGRPEPAAIDEPGGRRDDEFLDDDDYFDDEDSTGTTRRPGRYDDPDPTGRPVPIGGSVSFTDQNPLGRLRDEFLRAFGHDPGLLNTVPIGNGAEPLPEFGDADELGRDDGLRKFFEHALRRDQLRDELATWAASRDVGIDEVATRAAADALLERLRAESIARTARVAEFAAMAERMFFPDSDESSPAGARLGDQAVRVPFANGPERLIIVDGLSSRDHVLAGLLADDPDLARQLDGGELVLNYGVAQTDWSGQVRIEPVETPEVRFRREVVDGRELAVTLLRDGDGPWRPVLNADEVAPTPQADPDTPPRSPAAVLTDLVQAVRDLGLNPLALNPDQLAELIPDLRLDNAVRATQIEALSDFTRSANDIQTFHDVSDARSHLATRLGLTQAELTPDTLAAALTDTSTARALRTQQVADLVAYAKQLREINPAAVDAARDQLALRLVSEDTARRLVPKRFIARVNMDPRIMALLAPGYVDAPDGKRVYAVSKSELSAKKLRKLIRMLERDGQHALLRDALTEYATALHQVDVYSAASRGDESADPRVVDGRLPMHDPDAVYSLREVVAAAMRGRDGTDFAQVVAEAAARPDSGPLPSDPSRRPTASRDWARIVGVDITDADDATFRKVYEAYRDGRIEKHEGLSPEQLVAELAALRGEIRLRADQIDTLERLLAELDSAMRAEGLPTDDSGQLPGAPDPTPQEPDSGPDSDPSGSTDPSADGGNQRPPGEAPDESQPSRKPDNQLPDPLAQIDAALERESAALDKAFTDADEKSAAEHDRVADDLDQIDGDIATHAEYVAAVRDL
ncbi:T3SS effector HopA1 family protein, partial [Nocardia sp. NPDC057663]|uniref:WXG100-like domain-containing protein n=1 Tax=Nocardia sp. NPDC057663 TaxID=3346201 RepID=UPI00366FAF5F